jgi:hypothetical protein
MLFLQMLVKEGDLQFKVRHNLHQINKNVTGGAKFP